MILIVPLILIIVKNDPADIGQFPDDSKNSFSQAPKSALLKEALRSSAFWIASLGFATCGFTLYMTTMHLPKLAADLGGAASLGGQLLGIAAFASAISMWLTGQIANKVGKKNLLILLYTIRLIAFIWLATATNLWQLYPFAIVYGLSSMPIIPLVTGIIGERFGKNTMGSILGFVWLLHQAFAASGVFIAGYFRTATDSYAPAFWVGTGVLAFGTIITIFMHNDHSNDSNQSREFWRKRNIQKSTPMADGLFCVKQSIHPGLATYIVQACIIMIKGDVL